MDKTNRIDLSELGSTLRQLLDSAPDNEARHVIDRFEAMLGRDEAVGRGLEPDQFDVRTFSEKDEKAVKVGPPGPSEELRGWSLGILRHPS